MSIPKTPPIRELDVRPLFKAGREPFQAIMEAAGALAPGEALRLIAPFSPVPLFSVMANRGFAASDRALGDGDWEVIFSPVGAVESEEGLATGSSPSAASWGEPLAVLDFIGAEPAAAVAGIMEALDELRPGDVLFALFASEPASLFPELAKRQHEWAGNLDAAGSTFRLLVRHGGGSAHA